MTIRQEDLDSAIRNATTVAGLVGTAVGAVVGGVAGRSLHWKAPACVALGAAVGALAGSASGKQIAVWSRRRAAELIAHGNQTVLQDIGVQSARFLQMLEEGASPAARRGFFAGLRPGPAEQHGQDKLSVAFRAYLVAFDAPDRASRREAMIRGNGEIVHHEHIRLEPYIRGAMPTIIRRCATRRLMTFDIGDRVLSVGEDLPGLMVSTAAADWTNISERMRYIFALFRKFHDDPALFLAPSA